MPCKSKELSCHYCASKYLVKEYRPKRMLPPYYCSAKCRSSVEWIGKRYGAWTVVSLTENTRMVVAKCDCGKEKKVYRCSLVTGASKSCGGHRLVTKQPEWQDKMVIRSSGCIEFTGAINAGGYGVAGCGLVHREVYRRDVGKIPEGLFVLHTCDNRKCTNPEHLFLGTNDDNMKDMSSKGRGRSWPGEYNCMAKLTQKQADDIKMQYANTHATQTALANIYNVSQRTISLIVRGISYKTNPNIPGTHNAS